MKHYISGEDTAKIEDLDDTYVGETLAKPTLSDEEIKLHILDMFKGDLVLGDIKPEEKQDLDFLFQWVKGE